MYKLHPYVLLLMLLAAHVGAAPVTYTGTVGGEARSIEIEVLELAGRRYVALGPIAEAFGGVAQLVNDQAQVDLDGKTAIIRANSQRVNTTTSQFSLGQPLLLSDGGAWIAPEDVTALFTNAFGVPVRLAQASPSPASEPALIDVAPLIPLEPLLPLPDTEPSPLPESPPLLEPLTETPPIAPLAPPPTTAELLRPVLTARTIVIDPGHGGSDPGIVGVSGLTEHQVVLAVASFLHERLSTAGFQVILTRSEDSQDLGIKGRVDLANSHQGDLLISLHAGSSPSPSPHGVNVFYPYGPGGPGPVSLARTTSPLGEPIRNSAGQSKVAADAIADALSKGGDVEVGKVRQIPMRAAAGLNMPCVLVELGHLTNNTEEGLLRGAAYQQKLADAIADGLLSVYRRPGGGSAQ